MPKHNKSLTTSKSIPSSEEHSGIKKKQNTQTVLVNSIRKKKIERAIKNDYETEKAKKEEDKNDFLSKMSEDYNPTSTEGQFEMMRGLMKKTTKKSGLDIFDDDEEMEESKKKDEEPIDENHLVKTSEQQVSILEKVLSKKKKSEELKKKYEKKEAMEKIALEQLPFSKSTTKSTTTPSSTSATTTSSVKSTTTTTTTDFIPLAVPQTEVKSIDKDLPFVKAPISKTICLHCERERTIRGLMIKYVIVTNDQDEVIYHAASEDTLRAIAEDKEAVASSTQANISLGEVTYSLLTIREHLSKIFRKTFVIVGYTIYNDMIGIFGPRNIREFQSKLRDVGIVDPNTEQPLDRSMLTNVSVLLSKLLGLNNTKKMTRIENTTNIYKAYKLHSKIFDKYSKQSSLDLLGFEERQLIKKEKKVQYQQKYMTAINGSIDNILSQMKNK
ncbi:predicted protein [Naegleria gruberi]|uniref:Predicted protein n=1 Tax=Naegleria gruberi TaxID=5762 RepID=D2VNF8_NAEGR|nr:uncharacterized protein NAEGRDRAFT_50989 [Naegleria gruberi]EFC41651.1 predicted protein [Naegleria gruberi]|eukprot:XP_002674395.1 predicted protein [Naegleria gruberi strain NEG-M]